jgi:nitrogen fixation/metabolism regulation signal transduction histidine kinase
MVTLVLSFYIFKNNKLLFIVSEFLILISVVLSWQLYRQMLKPLQTVVNGIDAIKDKDFNVNFLHTGSYEMDRLVDVYNDMMDHLKTERTRQEQQHFFLEKLIQTSPTGILILDFDANIQQVNPKACMLLGASEKELLAQPIEAFDKPLMREISMLKSGEGKTISLDGVHTYKIQRSHFIDRGFARSFVMIEELTADILAAEKKAYGKVIRMMAHEVNNTLGPVNSIIESTLRTKELFTKEHAALEHALQVAFERNQNLNIFMRNFADVVRRPMPDKTTMDVNHLAKRVATLFGITATDTRIQVRLDITEAPFMIYADQQQLEQALINIMKNSLEAIETDGIVAIEADPQARKLFITDSGMGISKTDAEHLFSPFFSTKKDGQGVGLTLVREILINHGFSFSLKTVDVAKTVFEIRFGDSVN